MSSVLLVALALLGVGGLVYWALAKRVAAPPVRAVSAVGHVAGRGPRGFVLPLQPPPQDLPLLAARVILYKHDGSGYFLQHPMSELHWAEVDKDTATVKGWRASSAVAEGVQWDGQLLDVSIPNVGAKTRISVTIIGPDSSQGLDEDPDWITVGWHGTVSHQLPLLCYRKTGCYFRERRVKPRAALRTLYKNQGGALQESANGHMWVESNRDGGDWLYRFGVMLETNREIVLLDHSRDMWIKIKPPPPDPGMPYQSARSLLGQQKDAGKGKGGTEFSPWTLLSESCDPQLSCKSTLKALDAQQKAANNGPPLHMVFSVDDKPRYEWLSLAFQFWWQRSQDHKRGSRFTRLLSAAQPDKLMDRIPTFLAPVPAEFATDPYLPYNKITAVLAWIQAEHARLPPDQIVVIMDVDIVLLEDISYMAVNVKRGHPLGAHGFMSFTGENSLYDRVVERYCPACNGRADPLAVPYFIHKDDLLALAPRWLEVCRAIRKDTLPWEAVKDWRAESPIQLSWTAEQWAYLLAAAEMGLFHTIREDMSAFTSEAEQPLEAPMIHFSDWTVGLGPDRQPLKWNKAGVEALQLVPNVDPTKGAVNRAMIEALQDFRAAHYPHLKPAWAER